MMEESQLAGLEGQVESFFQHLIFMFSNISQTFEDIDVTTLFCYL